MDIKEFVYKCKWRLARPDAFYRWRIISNGENLSADELANNQEIARRRIVSSAYSFTRFYRELYEKVDFCLGDMGHDGWFEKLPVVTKDDLRGRFESFIDQRQRRFLKTSTTGGSTGVPTKTGYDMRLPEEVYSWRLQQWFNVHPWEDHAYVWRDTSKSAIQKLKNSIIWWPTRHLKMDATLMTEDSIRRFINQYNRLMPAILQGYVGAITQLAQVVVEKGMFVHSPKFVWTTSAPLPETQRNLIQRAFRAPVCDQYGSCEVRWIAQQCSELKGLHVNTEHVHIEFVDEKNIPVEDGVYGKTLLTNLEDTVFPLIRYENGDRGRWLGVKCPCGRSLPVMDSVKGRESESFVLPSGKTINGEYLTTIFDSQPELVDGFRVVQHKNLDITIEYTRAHGNERDQMVRKLAAEFSEKIGDEVCVNVRRVNEITHDRGKSRFIIREK